MGFVSTFNPFFASVWKTIKAIAAVFMYMLATCFTFVGESLCIAFSYVLQNTDVVWMWSGFLLFMTGMWAAAGWLILSCTIEKKRDDAHLTLWPIAFITVCTTTALSLAAAAVAMWSHSGYDALGFAVIFTSLAGAALHYLFSQAVKAWQGERTRFV